MSSFISDNYPNWQRRIKLLLESAWRETRLNEAKVDQWLRNFKAEVHGAELEQRLAFHLLQQFVYFGSVEVDECMRVLFRDHLVSPAIHELRALHPDASQLEAAFENRIVNETRFFGVGHPAESGTGMLYRFRKVNGLPTASFPNLTSIFVRNAEGRIETIPTTLRHLIFLDDLCATGDQVQLRMRPIIQEIKAHCPQLRVSYFVLVATARGLANVRSSPLFVDRLDTRLFNDVVAAVVFEDDYAAFGASSLCYRESVEGVSQSDGERLCTHYGSRLQPDHPLGYGQSQLLLGFQHNTPDNTLPIFWDENNAVPWIPIFPRAHKY